MMSRPRVVAVYTFLLSMDSDMATNSREVRISAAVPIWHEYLAESALCAYRSCLICVLISSRGRAPFLFSITVLQSSTAREYQANSRRPWLDHPGKLNSQLAGSKIRSLIEASS